MASPKIRWTKVDDGGLIPKPRHGHRAIAVRELMIVFGGGNEGIIDDLHAYNTLTNQWFCPIVKGDIPHGTAAFGLAADNCRLLFFGGMLEYGHYSNQLYELQVGSYFSTGSIASKWEWKKIRPKPPRFAPAPSPRLGHSFTHIADKFYVFGGLTNDCPLEASDNPKVPQSVCVKYLNELYVLIFNGTNYHWELPHTYGNPPSPRESHSAVGHTDSLGYPKLLVYGGMSGFRLGDLWVLDISSMTWSQPVVDGPRPFPRSLHSSSIVGDKMYVFGGWVPASTETQTFEREWRCTSSLARLNLNAFMWENFEVECPQNWPPPRAGHSAVTVGSRIYIWSGRDGYQREWNTQVCCRDLWYLEVEKPSFGGKIHLVKAATNMLDLGWMEVPFCDNYVLQIMKYTVTNPKSVAKKKRNFSESESCTDDVQKGLQTPTASETPPSPLGPLIPSSPLKVDDLPIPQPVPLEELTPPVPPVIPKPPLSHHSPASHTKVVLATQQSTPQVGAPVPPVSSPKPRQMTLANDCQPAFVESKGPDAGFVGHIRNPGLALTKIPGKDVAVTQPKMVSSPGILATQPAVKGVPPGATVVKVLNNAPQPQPKFVTISNPQIVSKPVLKEVLHTLQPSAPSKHQAIIINKPVNKPPGQQIVVVPSSAGQLPTQTIQERLTSRPNSFNNSSSNVGSKQLKVAIGNGVTKTLTIQGRTPPSATSQIQMALQNQVSAYKNVKVQVGGKTLTMMMPVVSSTASPSSSVVNSTLSGQPAKLQSVTAAKTSLPKMTIVQDSSQLQFLEKANNKIPPLISRNQKFEPPSSKEGDFESEAKVAYRSQVPHSRDTKENTNDSISKDTTLKIVAPRSGASNTDSSNSKIIGQPVGSPGNISLVQNASKSTGPMEPKRPKLESKDGDFPDPPTNINIAKVVDGALISWSPPLKGDPPTGYCVTLGIKGGKSGTSNRVEFVSVYNDAYTKTKISQEFLDKATINLTRPTIIFRLSARNERGFGPATQIRWLLDSKNEPSAPDTS